MKSENIITLSKNLVLEIKTKSTRVANFTQLYSGRMISWGGGDSIIFCTT